MGIYSDVIFPRILHRAMQDDEVDEHRHDLIAQAKGRVLEIGLGSGLNLPHYGSAVTAITGIDPSVRLLDMARKQASAAACPVTLILQGAETLPFEYGTFETVAMTWTLCSVNEPDQVLREIRRVLKPGGRLLFIEHGHAPEARIQSWQDRLNPVWRVCAGGCNMNRPIEALMRGAGFAFERLETGYLVKGPKPLTYHYKGVAGPVS